MIHRTQVDEIEGNNMRARYVVAAILFAIGGAITVPFLVTQEERPRENAVSVPTSSSLATTSSPIIVTEMSEQLEAKGYTLIGSDYSTGDGYTTHWQTWSAAGQPTVHLTDQGVVPGVLVIDTVDYGETGRFTHFSCAPRDDAERNLEFTITGAEAVRAVVERGTVTPTRDPWVESTYLVGSRALDCYMTRK